MVSRSIKVSSEQKQENNRPLARTTKCTGAHCEKISTWEVCPSLLSHSHARLMQYTSFTFGKTRSSVHCDLRGVEDDVAFSELFFFFHEWSIWLLFDTREFFFYYNFLVWNWLSGETSGCPRPGLGGLRCALFGTRSCFCVMARALCRAHCCGRRLSRVHLGRFPRMVKKKRTQTRTLSFSEHAHTLAHTRTHPQNASTTAHPDATLQPSRSTLFTSVIFAHSTVSNK